MRWAELITMLGEIMNTLKQTLREIVIDILSGREKTGNQPITQFSHLAGAVCEVFLRREPAFAKQGTRGGMHAELSPENTDLLQEIFWDLFREKIITIGLNSSNQAFPWFRIHSEANLSK